MSKFCPSCGEELLDNAKFCKNCGVNGALLCVGFGYVSLGTGNRKKHCDYDN